MLCPERAEVFADLRCLELEDEEITRVKIRSCHRIDREDEIRFVRSMVQRKMCVLIEEHEVARHPLTGEMLKGGFFGVPHKPGKMRLIYDRRPANSLERNLSPDWLALPHGTQFCEIELKRHEGLRGSCDDLQCWFYQLRHEVLHWRKQAVGRRHAGEDFEDLGAKPGKHYRAVLCCVAMGDQNGVAYAQSAHEFILEAGGLMRPEHVLRYGESLPRSALLEGTYVDDHIISLKTELSRLHCIPGHDDKCEHCARDGGRLEDVCMVEQLMKAYDDFEVTRSEGKEVRHAEVF